MKLKLTVAAFLLSAGSAFAGCYTPELELSIDHNDNSKTGFDWNSNPERSIGNDVTFGISLNIPLGKTVSDTCSAELATERAEARKKQAEERDRTAEAVAQELDNLEQKINICSGFTFAAAPKSIKTFCGDLLQ